MVFVFPREESLPFHKKRFPLRGTHIPGFAGQIWGRTGFDGDSEVW